MSSVNVTFPGNIGAVPSLADLRNLGSIGVRDQQAMFFYSPSGGAIFVFDASSFEGDDGVGVIKPYDLTPLQAGRWVSVVRPGANGQAGAQGPAGPAGNGLRYVERAELLEPFTSRLTGGDPVTVNFSGDSTTRNSDSYAEQLQNLLSSFTNVTSSQTGAAGQHTGQWLSTYEPSEKAANYTLNVWGWGLNDLYTPYGRTLAQFEADLRAGMADYRSTRPAETNVVILLSPNTGTDDAEGRGAVEIQTLIPIIREVAIDFDCVFIDRFAMLPDAYGVAGLLTEGVHPTSSFAALIAGNVQEIIVPTAFRTVTGSTYMFGDPSAGLDAGLPPSAFPNAHTMSRVAGALVPSEYPLNGWVITDNPVSSGGSFAFQINYAFGSSGSYYLRNALNSTTWGAWVQIGGSSSATNVTPATGFTLPSSPPAGDAKMSSRAIGNGEIRGGGYIEMTTPAALTNGQALFALGTVSHRPGNLIVSVQLILQDAGGAIQAVTGLMDLNGQCVMRGTSSISPTRIYIDDTWSTVVLT